MPSFSKTLSDEGIAIKTLKIVENGDFEEERVKVVMQGGNGIIGTRNFADNLSDFKA